MPAPLPARFRRLAWATLGYNVLVILWGGVVRASGSGAGCGDHWPFCNGEVIPSNPALNTVVEFAHRVTSGIALPLVFWLVWRAFQVAPRGAAVRKAAGAAGVFIVLEAALGAGLVLFKYVAYNPSYARAVWMAGHLVNTLLLLAALALVAWWASGGSVPRHPAPGRALAVGAALAAVLVLSMGGAVTALGDTLVVGGGLDPASDPVVATLVGLRLFHPAMAFVALGVVAFSVWQSRGTDAAVVARGMTVVGLFVAQMGLGALNVGLGVPVWMQIVHLLMTDVVWIALVLWASEALAAPEASRVGVVREAV
ncbi:MAG TPA: COX15/CtaA family protein [Rubricoccaceae bacterium]|jgi:heme A synthase